MKLALTAVTALVLAVAARAEAPFADLTFDQALARAASEKKIVMIDFFTTWCPPCKKLDHVTWKDERVRAWIAEQTIALKIDAEQEVELAARYTVRAYPTLLFVDPGGKELERIVGFREPDEFLADAAYIASGRKLIERERERFAGRENDPTARTELASACSRDGLHEEALTHLVWCWDHGVEHALGYDGVRRSFLLGDIARLGAEYPPALETLREIRAACCARLFEGGQDAASARELVLDVVALNRALGERAETLRFHDELVARQTLTPESLRLLQTAFFDETAELLLEARRYDDVLAGLGGDPDAYANKQIMLLQTVQAELQAFEQENEDMPSTLPFVRNRTVVAVSRGYAALLGLGQTERASALAERLIAVDPSKATYETLVDRAAAHAGQSAPAVLAALLARAGADLDEKSHGRLERRIERAMRKAGSAQGD